MNEPGECGRCQQPDRPYLIEISELDLGSPHLDDRKTIKICLPCLAELIEDTKLFPEIP